MAVNLFEDDTIVVEDQSVNIQHDEARVVSAHRIELALPAENFVDRLGLFSPASVDKDTVHTITDNPRVYKFDILKLDVEVCVMVEVLHQDNAGNLNGVAVGDEDGDKVTAVAARPVVHSVEGRRVMVKLLQDDTINAEDMSAHVEHDEDLRFIVKDRVAAEMFIGRLGLYPPAPVGDGMVRISDRYAVTLVAKVLWLGLAVLPWALGLSVFVIYLWHSGFSVKKRDENVGGGETTTSPRALHSAKQRAKHGGRALVKPSPSTRGDGTENLKIPRPLLVSGPRPKCSRNLIWKKTVMVSIRVLTLAASAAVAPVVAVD